MPDGQERGAPLRAYVDTETLQQMGEDDGTWQTCPRCGYRAAWFDRMAAQPNYVDKRYLIDVKHCTRCHHYWAEVPDEWRAVLEERGLLMG